VTSDPLEIRVATVYKAIPLAPHDVQAMDIVRWMRVSDGLAEVGFQVDMIVGAGSRLESTHPNLRYIPLEQADWSAYHVIKTLYQRGFRQLIDSGGASHPFIISRLASVVGKDERVQGVHFTGAERAALYEVQEEIQRTSDYIALSTEPNRQLWLREFGDATPLLLVPTGVDRSIPAPARNPYRGIAGASKIAVYVGNLYTRMQRHVNLLWQERLNRLGALLRARAIQLVFVGPGLTDRLDPSAVLNLGAVPHHAVWDYQYFADVGLALAQGPVQHNESSKIYYYLRTGLPVVTEVPIPNNDVVTESGCGLIAPYGDDHALADMVEAAAHRVWDRHAAISYVLAHHTWDRRFAVYRDVIRRHFGAEAVATGSR
jgi:glycosyltransferase involved in cell wall biosynthesis